MFRLLTAVPQRLIVTYRFSRLLVVLPVAVLSLICAGCPTVPDDPGGGDPTAQRVTEYAYTDVSNGLIGEIDFGTGDHALVYGTRNADGTLADLDAVAVLDEDGGTSTEIFFDDDGLPTRIHASGSTWDIAWTTVEGSPPRPTITRDGQSQDLELDPEAAQLLDMLQNGELADSASGRGFNRVTVLGAISMGLGVAGFIGLAAATTPVAVGASVLGIIVGTASGGMTIMQSISDRAPTVSEQRVANTLTVLSLASGGASLVSGSANISHGVAVEVSERLSVVGLAVDIATMEQSELLSANAAAQAQACTNNPACEGGSNGGGGSGDGGDDSGPLPNPCCIDTGNCPSEAAMSCDGPCCCCGLGQVCVNYFCVAISSTKLSSDGGIFPAGGPQQKRALSRRLRD